MISSSCGFSLRYLGVHPYYLSGVAGRRVRVQDAWSTARFGRRQSWLIEGELPPGERLPGGTEPTEWQAPTR